ncbi:leading edge cell differentiation [Branchiostoma belcheri]|nr:leading edge cell differentiation [Branchiostoma belcheri]
MTSTVKKGKKEPLTDEEKVKQYEGDGMVFKGKVIGIDDVEAARGDKMCQDSMNKLKLAVKASGAHKQRITISVSLQGLKIIDLASGAINHRHPVHKISFIARDVTDNRAFGWVFSPGEGQHKFFAIKTEKQAEAVVLSIRDLFQTVYNVKKAEMDKKKQAQQDGTTDPTNGESYYQVPTNKPVEQDGEAQPAAAEQNAGEAKAGAQVGNLLDLEEELQSLQTGIKDMDKLADLFAAQPNDPFSSPDSTANTPNRQQDLFGSPVAPVFIQKDKAAFDRDKFVERWQLSLNNDSLFRKNRSRQQGANSDIARSRPKSRSSLKLQDWQSFEDPTSTVNENRLDASVKVTATNAPPVKEATADTPKVATPSSSEYDRFLFDKARLELIKSIHQEKPEPPPLSRSRNPFRSSLSTLDDVPRTRKMEVIPEKPVGNPFNPFRNTDSQDSASETVAPQVPARRRRAATGLTRSQSLVTLNEILTPMGSSSLPGSSATTPGDDFLNSLLQPIKANQPLQPIPVNQSQPVLIPTPVNSQSHLDSGSSKTSPERQIGVIRVLDDPFADSPFQQSPSQSESFSSSSQSQQSNPFSDSPFTVDRKEFVNGVSTTPVVNPFGGGDFSKPTTSFSTGGVITRETKTVFSTPVNKDLVKTDPFGDSFRVTTADSSTLATSAISTSFPESNESRDSERRVKY